MHNRRNHWNGEILACFSSLFYHFNQFKEVNLSFNITQAVQQQNQHGSFHVPLPLSMMHLNQGGLKGLHAKQS